LKQLFLNLLVRKWQRASEGASRCEEGAAHSPGAVPARLFLGGSLYAFLRHSPKLVDEATTRNRRQSGFTLPISGLQ
jgi:hypothetical protein